MLELKRFGRWKGDSVAQGYVDSSKSSKKRSADLINQALANSKKVSPYFGKEEEEVPCSVDEEKKGEEQEEHPLVKFSKKLKINQDLIENSPPKIEELQEDDTEIIPNQPIGSSQITHNEFGKSLSQIPSSQRHFQLQQSQITSSQNVRNQVANTIPFNVPPGAQIHIKSLVINNIHHHHYK